MYHIGVGAAWNAGGRRQAIQQVLLAPSEAEDTLRSLESEMASR